MIELQRFSIGLQKLPFKIGISSWLLRFDTRETPSVERDCSLVEKVLALQAEPHVSNLSIGPHCEDCDRFGKAIKQDLTYRFAELAQLGRSSCCVVNQYLTGSHLRMSLKP